MRIVFVAEMLREDILLALYNNAKYQCKKYTLDREMRSFNGLREKASQLVLERMKSGDWYFNTIDLGAGPRELRVKLGLKDTSFDAEDFDNAHGEDVAAKAMQALRVIHMKNVVQLNPEEQKASELPKLEPKLIVTTYPTFVSIIKDLEDLESHKNNQGKKRKL